MKRESWKTTMKRYDNSVKRDRRRTLLVGGVGLVIITLANIVVNKYMPKDEA